MLANPEVESRGEGGRARRGSPQGADEQVVNFLRLIAEKGRAGELAEIADELDALVAADAAHPRRRADDRDELSDEEFGRILGQIEKRVGPQGAGLAQGRPRPDRRDRPPGRIDEARRERARPARTTTPRLARKELTR